MEIRWKEPSKNGVMTKSQGGKDHPTHNKTKEGGLG